MPVLMPVLLINIGALVPIEIALLPAVVGGSCASKVYCCYREGYPWVGLRGRVGLGGADSSGWQCWWFRSLTCWLDARD